MKKAREFQSGNVYSVERSVGARCWSGVLEWNQILEWENGVLCHQFRDKARPDLGNIKNINFH